MAIRESRAGTFAPLRLMKCFINQKRNALVSPTPQAMEQRVVAVTGATNGIGMATTQALLKSGATVVMIVRNADKARRRLNDWGDQPNAMVVTYDLSDLNTLDGAIATLTDSLKGRRIDTLIENAGVAPTRRSLTEQGHELAFGTNVLGHFALRQAMIRHDLLAETARVIVVTGDIYILSSDCTPDYTYRTMLGASMAYNRSKLGNIWIAKALQERHPELTVVQVHPGVVASDLMVGNSALERAMKRLLLPTHLGAQTSLYCATQPVEKGGYYHNTRGLMRLSDNDPAMNAEKWRSLWDNCSALVAPYLPEALASRRKQN